MKTLLELYRSGARAHKYTHLRHEQLMENLTAGFRQNSLRFLPYNIEKKVNVK